MRQNKYGEIFRGANLRRDEMKTNQNTDFVQKGNKTSRGETFKYFIKYVFCERGSYGK